MPPLTFTQALLQAEAMARSTLPVELHERLSCAVSLVKDGHVFQNDAGVWQVESQKTEGRLYTTNGVCSCDDYHYNKPPQGLCKHRLAMFLSQRVQTLMQHPAVPVVPEVLPEPWPDNDPEEIPMAQPAPPPAPLPEAPASVNVRVTIAGREVQWTLRDSDEARLAIRLAALLARYPVPQSTPQASHQGEEGFCQKHDVHMKWNAGKDGKHGWYSHRTQDGWCKGK